MIEGLYKIFDHWHKEGTVWLISDTHFNDKELAVGTKCITRLNTEEYIKIINSKVGRKDTLIHLGDVGDLEAMKKIRGYKVLIMGNHDAGRSNYERKVYAALYGAKEHGREEVIAEMQAKYPGFHIKVSGPTLYPEEPVRVYYEATADNQLFDEVYEGPLMIAEKLILSHEPAEVPWAANIHGHVHDPKAQLGMNCYNICPDSYNDFEPVNFNQVMKRSGFLSRVKSLHRDTIDNATKRKKKQK